MVKTGKKIWDRLPHVRTGDDLNLGERAADGLKHWFGTWTVLGLIIAGILLWLGFVKDPGELHLNLGLSFLASVQGVVLQIAANRGDRISAELAQHTFENGKRLLEVSEQILGLQNQQMNILADIHAIRDTIEGQGET